LSDRLRRSRAAAYDSVHLLVLEWASAHRAELMEDWELCTSMQTPKRIPPLA
jgi:hypothetical protein